MTDENQHPAAKEEVRLGEPGTLDCDAGTGVCLVPGSSGVLTAASASQAAVVEIDYYFSGHFHALYSKANEM